MNVRKFLVNYITEKHLLESDEAKEQRESKEKADKDFDAGGSTPEGEEAKKEETLPAA